MDGGAASLELREERLDSPSAALLIERVQAEYVTLYGGPDQTPLHPEQFAPPRGIFLVGYLDDRPVACGGLYSTEPGTLDIKRMYVEPAVRGQGISREVLTALERAALRLGVRRLRLETGTRQPVARALYESAGYTPTDKFGIYACEPGSRCYAKVLEEGRADCTRA